jgi:hypothetical protein
MTVVHGAEGPRNPDGAMSGFGVVYAIGPLTFWLFGYDLQTSAGSDDPHLLIWPALGPDVRWPPRQTFEREAQLDELAQRMPVGTRVYGKPSVPPATSRTVMLVGRRDRFDLQPVGHGAPSQSRHKRSPDAAPARGASQRPTSKRRRRRPSVQILRNAYASGVSNRRAQESRIRRQPGLRRARSAQLHSSRSGVTSRLALRRRLARADRQQRASAPPQTRSRASRRPVASRGAQQQRSPGDQVLAGCAGTPAVSKRPSLPLARRSGHQAPRSLMLLGISDHRRLALLAPASRGGSESRLGLGG